MPSTRATLGSSVLAEEHTGTQTVQRGNEGRRGLMKTSSNTDPQICLDQSPAQKHSFNLYLKVLLTTFVLLNNIGPFPGRLIKL